MSWLEHLDYWQWLVLGVVLIVLEIVSPGVFLLWLGLAALGVGGILWWMPDLVWQTQLVIFAVFSVLSIGLARLVLRHRPIATDEPTLNRRGEQYLGRVFTLGAPIENGVGRVRVDDTLWRVEGPDAPAGSRVRVVGVDGTVFRVEPV